MNEEEAATSINAGVECGNCGRQTRGFLHNVRLRGIQRRLCSSCVLRLHPWAFCPLCFSFYDSNPPHPSKRLSCSKCGSFTHSQCATSCHPYLCPPCSDPTKSFTFLKNTNKIDSKSAAVLLCAAKIAAASMAKAVVVARVDAEKKARDAALARKRAREALERAALLICKDKATKNNELKTEIG